VLAGIRNYHARLVAHLEMESPSLARDRLLSALRRVPWQPAADFYAGLVAVNFLYYLDGCDNLGRFDQVLGQRYEADLATGRLSMDTGEQWVRQLWRNMDESGGWNVALGGSTSERSPAYNRLTITCLRAGRGLRRPNLALRIRRDMPQAVWDAALDTLASGCGLLPSITRKPTCRRCTTPGWFPTRATWPTSPSAAARRRWYMANRTWDRWTPA